jgi:hypothetical protein
MDHQRFAQHLPALYEGWGRPSARPRSGQFETVLARVRGMTSPGVLELLNFAVGCLEGEEAYAEVGCFQGATLVDLLRRGRQPALLRSLYALQLDSVHVEGQTVRVSPAGGAGPGATRATTG